MRNRGVEVCIGAHSPPSNAAVPQHNDLLGVLATAGVPGIDMQTAMAARHAHVERVLAEAAHRPLGPREIGGWASLALQLLARGATPGVAVNTAFDHVYMPLVPASVVDVVAAGGDDGDAGPVHAGTMEAGSGVLGAPGHWPVPLTVSMYATDANMAIVLRDAAPLVALLAPQHGIRQPSHAQAMQFASRVAALAAAVWQRSSSLATTAIVANATAQPMDDDDDTRPMRSDVHCLCAAVAAAVESVPPPSRQLLCAQLQRLQHHAHPTAAMLTGVVLDLVQHAPCAEVLPLTMDDALDVDAYCAATSVDVKVPQAGVCEVPVLAWRVRVLHAMVAFARQQATAAVEGGNPNMLQLSWWRQQHPQVCLTARVSVCAWVVCPLHPPHTATRAHCCVSSRA